MTTTADRATLAVIGSQYDWRIRQSTSRPDPSYVPPGRVFHSKLGVVRGDEADQWLRQNDPKKGRELHRRPVGPATDHDLDALEDLSPGHAGGSAIYFIQAETGGPVKIGWCHDSYKVGQRLTELQVGNPFKLVLRRAVYGRRRDELALHKRFASLRVSGEWFAVDATLARIARAIV